MLTTEESRRPLPIYRKSRPFATTSRPGKPTRGFPQAGYVRECTGVLSLPPQFLTAALPLPFGIVPPGSKRFALSEPKPRRLITRGGWGITPTFPLFIRLGGRAAGDGVLASALAGEGPATQLKRSPR
jgi:hypothetical protein